MRQTGFSTKVGSTTDLHSGSDVIVVSEPTLGATLRTKGRFYFLCEVSPPTKAGAEIAREVAALVREQYEYDLSAGIEVAMRKALRDANRRAAHRLRDQHGRVSLHCACAVIVNQELYAARVGQAQIFLVRRARLFLPGEDPDELADFVHRTTTRRAASLGSDPELLPSVWKQAIETGDTLILAGGATVSALGAETLLNAAVTLHPRAAAEHIHNRFAAEGGVGSDVVLFVEVAPSATTAPRIASAPDPVRPPEEVVIAESIRSRVDLIWQHRPRIGRAARAVTAPAAKGVTRTLAVGLELMPRRREALGGAMRTSRERGARQQRVVTLLAIGLLAVAVVIGGIVVRDYQANQIVASYNLAVLATQTDISSAVAFLDRKPADDEKARLRIATARAHLAEAARSTAANAQQVATLGAQIDALADRANNVLLDLAIQAAGARVTQLTQTPLGLYAADPGSGRLWRIFGDPLQTRPVLQRGTAGVGAPILVTAVDAALFSIDEQNRIWRAEGSTVTEIDPVGHDKWKSVTGLASFLGNIYVLDAASGQIWRHEGEGVKLGPAEALLAPAVPANTMRSFAVDGAIWIVTTNGDLMRFRRTGFAQVATREDLTVRWLAEPVRASAVQALDSQRNIYLLDAPGRRLVRLTRDGREIARFDLPRDLPEPTAFFVAEGQQILYTAYGSKIVATDLSR